ncbi:MAG: recombinase family protein [Phycisphaerales bacterium]|nr:recombinase family protein [Phycisphaerales bacterium]
MHPSSPIPSRFAIYTRQSVDTAKDVSSCDGQFMVCMDCARAYGERDTDWIGERFDDQGWSGANLDRPAIKRLREAISDNRVKRVYAVALDRLSRTMRDSVLIMDELDAAGVELRFVHQPGLGTTAEGRFLRHIIGSFAQFEHELIVGRLSDTRLFLKAHGRRLAGPPPYGYDADPKSKQLVPSPVEAKRLRTIFEMAASGTLPTEIARHLNGNGWTTKQRLSKRSGKNVGGGKWTARQVLDVLNNPVCLGVFADNDKVRPGCHSAIIDLKVFSDAASHLDARRRSGKSPRISHQFPLRGKVVCPGCERPMSTYTVPRRLGPRATMTYRYYRCRATAGGRPPCSGRQYPAIELERFVSEILETPGIWRELLTEVPPRERLKAAKAMTAAWSALDFGQRNRLIPQMVDRIEFSTADDELAITFMPGAVGLVNALKMGTSESSG